MGRSARLIDVAEAAGVSKATASNVFNRPELVRDEVRARVLAAAEAIGYAGPDPRGRMLSAGKVNAIGVASAEPLAYFFEDPFARALTSAIAAACDAQGVGLSLVHAEAGRDVPWTIRSALVDGLILFCLADAGGLVAASRERRLPFVALGIDETDAEVPAVGVDDRAGARRAARHLTDLGHRRFAILAMPFDEEGGGRSSAARAQAGRYAAARARAQGYLEVLADCGLSPEATPIFETDGVREVEAALAALYDDGPGPTALLAQSDRIALLALEGLRARDVAVPGQVSIVGFDGVPEAAASAPPLTTIAQPIDVIGHGAVRVLLDRPEGPWREILPTALVLGGTTAPPPDVTSR